MEDVLDVTEDVMQQEATNANKFAIQTLNYANESKLNYNEVFAGLVQSTAAMLISYTADLAESKSDVSIVASYQKYIENLQQVLAQYMEVAAQELGQQADVSKDIAEE